MPIGRIKSIRNSVTRTITPNQVERALVHAEALALANHEFSLASLLRGARRVRNGGRADARAGMITKSQ